MSPTKEESNSKRGASSQQQTSTATNVAANTITASNNSNSNQEDEHEPQSKKMKLCSDLHVEAMIHPCCTLPLDDLKQEIEKFIVSTGQKLFSVSQCRIQNSNPWSFLY